MQISRCAMAWKIGKTAVHCWRCRFLLCVKKCRIFMEVQMTGKCRKNIRKDILNAWVHDETARFSRNVLENHFTKP